MPTDATPGRSIVTRRAVVDIVRNATLGSYGVTGFAGGLPARIAERLGWAQPGVRVGLGDELTVELDLTVGRGLPVAEVARQVESAVRYAVRVGLGREVARLAIHVDGLAVHPGPMPEAIGHAAAPAGVRPDDLAASGTDLPG